eukprot:2637302-Rhodomonas_salina.2
MEHPKRSKAQSQFWSGLGAARAPPTSQRSNAGWPASHADSMSILDPENESASTTELSLILLLQEKQTHLVASKATEPTLSAKHA